MNCVALFDIDGTLLSRSGDTASPGIRAMNEAAREATGVTGLADRVDFAGATDLRVAARLLVLGGMQEPSRAQVDALLDAYVGHLRQFISDDSYIALGDPHRAIPRMAAMGAVIGLATGNVKAGARIKLASAGIDHLFCMDRGGFGDDAEDRPDIVRIAARRCDPEGLRPVAVIGDTVHDIRGAHAAGAICIGVPGGRYTAAMLTAAGADEVVDAIGDGLVAILARRFG
jgi:phosphoglycolate phosphatase-like HAD superfamily hydrolase